LSFCDFLIAVVWLVGTFGQRKRRAEVAERTGGCGVKGRVYMQALD